MPAAGAATLEFGVAGFAGSVRQDIQIVRSATTEAPVVELYNGTGTTVLRLTPGTKGTTPAGSLDERTGGRMRVPTRLGYTWSESAATNADGARRTCTGRAPGARNRVLIHSLTVKGKLVTVRWSLPRPQLGRHGCDDGPPAAVVAEDTYPIDTFDHARVKLVVLGSDHSTGTLAGSRTRSVRTSWSFSVTLVRL